MRRGALLLGVVGTLLLAGCSTGSTSTPPPPPAATAGADTPESADARLSRIESELDAVEHDLDLDEQGG
ncbi:hypothetical protein [Pseudonocardia oroxyli]|uniref:Uncharacterized protein n=1 Tax=Pseudonocardia oroxyli TaxID=366584 RepID=A0A1G7VSR1_PSEOR|nr:hypothetical protein [Pseudonocardia oroxyli]SDG62621.1 hypothetical protein SAMN05216377_113160 [Pseudonocardia oroxyli]